MKTSRSTYIAAILAAVTATSAQASNPLPFSPLPNSGTLNATGVGEDKPFLLPAGYTQSVLVDQKNIFTTGYQPGSVGGGVRWGNWDMLTLNETGPDAGRYMFIPHEINGQGVSRYDFVTGKMVNIAVNNTVLNGRLDPARWTPWGTVIAGDEQTRGSIFEITNPLAADPTTIVSTRRLDIGRVAFEGISRGKDGNWYYGDEAGNGSLFKYVPKAANVGTSDELVGGQIFALKIVGGTTTAAGNVNGTGTWVPLNDVNGVPTTGAVGSATDPRVDSRAAAVAAGATQFNRPEDSVITTLANGHEAFLITVTGTHSTITLELDPSGKGGTVRDFATRDTINLATGQKVGTQFENNDNIALGPDGRIYIVEDNEPIGGDIWATVDLNNDGVLSGPGEGMGRFASLLTNGSEPTGLYWDSFRHQWLVNVQHPTSGNNMTIAIRTVPDGGSSFALFGLAMLGVAGLRRAKRA